MIADTISLPASPLWIAGLYSPQFASINAVFPPPVWIAVCIFVMELSTIGFPIMDVMRVNNLRQETLDAIAIWESRQEGRSNEAIVAESKDPGGFSTTTTLKSGPNSIAKVSLESQRSDMLTMANLESALRTNPIPLLQFAALKDFSGENISFLTHIADWQRVWSLPKASPTEHFRKQFVAATRIYAHFISLEFSEFPINISSKEMKRLHNMFEAAANILYRHKRDSTVSNTSDNATPFADVLPTRNRRGSYSSTMELRRESINLGALGRANLEASECMREHCADEVLAEFEIAQGFGEEMFEAAEKEIKYLVLTNTWPKFIHVERANSLVSREEEPREAGGSWVKRLLC